MVSYYTVVQYVPDPVIDERINVGVIVFGGGQVESRFVQNWNRVRRFGGKGTEFLEDFAESVKMAPGAQLATFAYGGRESLNEDAIRSMARRWKNSIQLTEPRASLLSVDELLADAGSRFLREPSQRRKRARSSRAAAAIAANYVMRALRERAGQDTERYVKREYYVDGRVEAHEFDIVVANGRPLSAAQAISFEVTDADSLERDIDRTAWAASDIRDSGINLAVVALPPREPTKPFDRAGRVFSALDVAIFTEDQFQDWAAQVADKVAAESPSARMTPATA